MRKRKLFLLLMLQLIIFSIIVSAAIKNTNVKSLAKSDYSDIWLGLSTGGYRLLAEDGSTYSFRLFIKNGMSDRSLHNIKVYPKDFPFEINSVSPKNITQLKPMEIRIIWINVTIPKGTKLGSYDISFDISSEEFPKGIFILKEEIKVVKKIKKELYPIYTIIILGLLAWVFIRKIKINNINLKETKNKRNKNKDGKRKKKT